MEQPMSENTKYQGRFTRDVEEYELLIPEKVDHAGSFVSYSLPHFYKRNATSRVRRSIPTDFNKIHYKIKFNGTDHHLEMWPNHALISPGAMVEERGSHDDVSKIKIRRVNSTLCHYKGRVKGHNNSRLALSTCDGLVGYVKTNHDHFFIEPVEEHEPGTDGQHLHMVYRKSLPKSHKVCGTENWTDGWKQRLRREYGHRSGSKTNLKADAERRLKHRKRTTELKHRYLEILVVADKRFLNYHNNTDYESYILTVMNMASDFYHDESTGSQIDFVVVRIIYLSKEEKELDLIISQNAEATLHSFCNWQSTINPHDYSHPNHHDIAVLLTRYDICSDNMSQCGLLGLAYVAEACNPNMSCAINEDTGLLLGVVVTHEVGHVMGCGHDNPDEMGCQPNVDEHYAHVMSPYVQLATANWSSCSKKFIQEFLDNDLGDCLLDEPQDHNFKVIDMPPGAMYDATFQCKLTFKSPDSEFCDQGPEKNCEMLYCTSSPDACVTNGQPPAEGTKCGNNMWCYNRKCVPIGERPEAINGDWGDWNKWSECSRTCGGGIMYSERECNNPTPKYHGRYCLGERRQYRICNPEPCDPESPTFREKQCSEHDKKGESWRPFINKVPDDICKLLCMNNARVIMVMEPRVKDGTPCKPGTKDVCIAGKCRVIGCDWIIDSDAVEDQCGICRGDGTQCTIVDEIFNKTGNGYAKITVIPKGSTKISVEEVKPIPNTLALTAADECTFLINGDYTEENDEELRIAGTIGYYFHPEEDLEQIIIAGPTTQDIVLFACFFSPNNPGIHYRYAIRTGNESAYYLPKYHWEFLEWNNCDKRCGGGIQEAEPSCIEERDGKVSDAFCAQLKKPKAKTRLCNEQPCKSFWKLGEWGTCDGSVSKSGHRKRVVQCVKESPNEDEDIIIDESNCGGSKPKDTERCNSNRLCNKRVKKSTEETSHFFRRKHKPRWEKNKRWHFKRKYNRNAGTNSTVVKKHVHLRDRKQPKVKKIRMHRYHKMLENVNEGKTEANSPRSTPIQKQIAKKITINQIGNNKQRILVQFEEKEPKQQIFPKKDKMKDDEKSNEHKGIKTNETELPNNGSQQQFVKKKVVGKDNLFAKKKPFGKEDIFAKNTTGKDDEANHGHNQTVLKEENHEANNGYNQTVLKEKCDEANNGHNQTVLEEKCDEANNEYNQTVLKEEYDEGNNGNNQTVLKEKCDEANNGYNQTVLTEDYDEANNGHNQTVLKEDYVDQDNCTEDRQHNETKQNESNITIVSNETTCEFQNETTRVNETSKTPSAGKTQNDSCQIQLRGGPPIGSIVKDAVPKKALKVVEIPILEAKYDIVLSDEGSEALGDKLSDILDTKDEKVFEGEEAIQRFSGEGNNTKTQKKDKEYNFVENVNF